MEITVVDGAESLNDLEMVNFAFEMSETIVDDGDSYVSRYKENAKQSQVLSDRIVLMAKEEHMTPDCGRVLRH